MTVAHIARFLLLTLNWLILGYFVVINSMYAALLISAFVEMRKHLLVIRGESRWRVLGSAVAPRISVLAPAHNEAATITDSVQSFLALYYPNLEVVMINDGSTDNTIGVLIEQFDLVPIHPIYNHLLETKPVKALYRSRRYTNLVVVDKENGGKADALNVGLNIATGTLVCAIDADTLIEPDAMQRMIRPFVSEDNVIAAGGTIRVANEAIVQDARVVTCIAPRNPLAGFQVVEYLRAFLFGRLGWNRLGGNLIISGAFGLFQKEAMVEAGGYKHDTVGEDMEIVVRLRQNSFDRGKPGKVAFIPDPVAWTEAPESLRVLARQRDRWQRGLTDCLWRHRKLFFNPKYGAMGMVVYPYFVFVELLSPLIEALGLIGLAVGLLTGIVDVEFAALFFLVAYGLGMVFTLLILALDEWSFHRYEGVVNRLVLMIWALLENVGYRQLTVFWRLVGMFKYMRGVKSWGTMERRGFQGQPLLARQGDRATNLAIVEDVSRPEAVALPHEHEAEGVVLPSNAPAHTIVLPGETATGRSEATTAIKTVVAEPPKAVPSAEQPIPKVVPPAAEKAPAPPLGEQVLTLERLLQEVRQSLHHKDGEDTK